MRRPEAPHSPPFTAGLLLISLLVCLFLTIVPSHAAADAPKKGAQADAKAGAKAEADEKDDDDGDDDDDDDDAEDDKDDDDDVDKTDKKDAAKPKPTKPAKPGVNKKATPPADVELPASVTDAVEKLEAEYEAATGKDSQEILREQCDYFKDNPADGITPEVLVAALEQKLGDKPRADAYIKWQLLGAHKAKFEGDLIPRALAVYKNAPKPEPRMGTSSQQRAELDKKARSSVRKAEDAIMFNEQFDKMLTRHEEGIRPLTQYRNELWDHLPITVETIKAGFEDAASRLSSGADAEDHLDQVCTAARSWALSGEATAPQLNAMAGLLTSLQKKPAPGYYSRLNFQKGQAKWDVVEPDRKQLETLVELLKERAKAQKVNSKSKD